MTVIWTIAISILALTANGDRTEVNVSFEGWYDTRALCYADTPKKREMLLRILERGAIRQLPRGDGVTISMEPTCYKQQKAVV